MAELHNIERIYNVIDNSLFMTTGELDYDRITDAIIKLANSVDDYFEGPNAPKFEGYEVWDIGENSGGCTLSELIVGAYWHYTEWHNGQWSKGYAALSALGQVFNPGMTMPERDNEAYVALEAMTTE